MICPSDMMTSRRRLSLLILALMAVLAGGMLYILFRPDSYVFYRWIEALGLDGVVGRIRSFSMPLLDKLPVWFVYSLPNGLWAFAYTVIICILWAGSRSRWRYAWYASIVVLVVGFELLQLTDLIAGTFCWVDMAFGAGGMGCGISFFFARLRA